MQHNLTQANRTRDQSNWRAPVKPVVCGLAGQGQLLNNSSVASSNKYLTVIQGPYVSKLKSVCVWVCAFGCLCILIFSANTMGHVPILTI